MQQTEKRQTRRVEGKLLQFSSGVITQEDLVEEYLLRQELKRVKERHHQKCAWIRMQLILGAVVEPGPRHPRLEERLRENPPRLPDGLHRPADRLRKGRKP